MTLLIGPVIGLPPAAEAGRWWRRYSILTYRGAGGGEPQPV